MFSAFVHSRPLLRALLVLVLLAGLLGTAAATHVSLTCGHSVAAAIDTADGDLDTSALDDTVSAQDNACNDTLVVPDGLVVPRAQQAHSRPMTAHAVPLRWHASSALRPPIVRMSIVRPSIV